MLSLRPLISANVRIRWKMTSSRLPVEDMLGKTGILANMPQQPDTAGHDDARNRVPINSWGRLTCSALHWMKVDRPSAAFSSSVMHAKKLYTRTTSMSVVFEPPLVMRSMTSTNLGWLCLGTKKEMQK